MLTRDSSTSVSGRSAPSVRSLPHVTTVAVVVLYACATLQFVRFYTVSTTFYLNWPAYLAGHERLPFQYRILPALLTRGMYTLHLLPRAGLHTKGAFTAERAPLYLLGLFAVSASALCTQALYSRVSARRPLRFVVFPVLLFTLIWTYSIHVEANFSYPYDLLSVAFFSAGLLCIFSRRYAPLLAIMVIGTLNRETTLFLVGLYILDAASPLAGDPARPGAGFAFRQVPWLRAAALFLVWLLIKLLLSHWFGANDRSEDYIRLRENVPRLAPRLWPALLNICGYMLPIVLLLGRQMKPVRFRNYVWILPFWFAVMMFAGVIVETRIYGELCPYVAVALVLLIEQHLLREGARPESEDLASTVPQTVARG